MFNFLPLFKFQIEGNSMNPTFRPGDVVLVNRFSYLFGKPKSGDLVVLNHEKYIIKRIAKIKENKIFVVGDNKKESTDSRNFGWIPRKEIVGKVICRLSS